MAKARYRIFVSSPGDMGPERQLVGDAVARLNASLPDLSLEIYLSEQDLYFAHRGPQEGIPLTSDYDLVVCLLWKRIGTLLLPEKFDAPGGRKRTGTEFEFETAVEAARNQRTETGLPHPAVLVYRKTQAVLFNAEKVDEQQLQYRALNAFFERWIRDVNGHYLGYANSFETTQQFSGMFERHLRDWLALQRRGVDWDIAQRGSPFRGLDVFDGAHAEVFFGRDSSILAARGRLKRAADKGFGALWIIGASGSGKSSLLRAGLLPSLIRSEGFVRPVVFKPSELGSDAVAGFVTRLYSQLPELAQGSFGDGTTLARVCIESPVSAGVAAIAALDLWAAEEGVRRGLDHRPPTRLVVAIDQAEEWLTVRTAVERENCVRLLLALLDTGRVWLVVSFRSDFYAALQLDARLLPLKERAAQLDLGAPTAADFALIIREPVLAAGLTLESKDERSLAEELAADAGNVDGLPMLQFALTALFDLAVARQDRVLRLADYDAMGRAAGALSSAAESKLLQTSAGAQETFARVLRELVDMNLQSESGTPTARTVALARFAGDGDALGLIEALSGKESRLLSLLDVDGQPHCRVVHESLFIRWPRAREQIQREARRLDARRRVEEDATLWEDAAPEDKSHRLLSGLTLQEALDLRQHWPLDPSLVDFIDRSSDVARDLARRKERLRKAVVATFAAAAIAAAGIAWYARQQQSRAEASEAAGQRMLHEAARRSFGQMQDALLADDLPTAHAHLAESLRYRDTPQARLAATYQLQRMPYSPHRVLPERLTRQASYSADGSRLVTTTSEGTTVWNSKTALRTTPLFRHGGSPLQTRLTPDAAQVITAGAGAIRRWDANTGVELVPEIRFAEGRRPVQLSDNGAVAALLIADGVEIHDVKNNRINGTLKIAAPARFSPPLSADGSLIAIPQPGGSVALISTSTLTTVDATSPLPLRGPVRCLRFTPDENLLIGAGRNSLLWNRKERRVFPIEGLSGCTKLSFSPDGVTLAALGERIVEIRRMYDGTLLKTFAIDARPTAASFSPDSLKLLIASDDNQARQWLIPAGQPIGTPLRHPSALRSAEYSPDGLTVMTVATDGMTRLWEARADAAPETKLWLDESLVSAEFSRDGRFVLAVGGMTSQLVSANDMSPVGAALPHADDLTQALLSPDARWVLTRDTSGEARLWEAGATTPTSRLIAIGVTAIAFSADGQVIATGDENGRVRCWGIPGLRPLAADFAGKAAIAQLRFSPTDARLAIAEATGELTLWNFDTDTRHVTARPTAEGAPLGMAFSTDGSRFFMSFADRAQLWSTAEELRPLGSIAANLLGADFSPDGRSLLVTHEDGTIGVHDAELGTARLTKKIGALQWSVARYDPDGRRVVAAHGNAVHLLDAETLELLGPPLPFGAGLANDVVFTSFSPDGQQLIAAGDLDSAIRIWNLLPSLEEDRTAIADTLSRFAGVHVDENGRLAYVPQQSASGQHQTESTSSLARIAAWHHADRGTRTGSPSSTELQSARVRRAIESALENADLGQRDDAELALIGSYRASPEHPLILLAMLLLDINKEHSDLALRLSESRLLSTQDADIAARGAELLRKLDKPSTAMAVALHALKLDGGNVRASAVRRWAETATGSATPTAATSAPAAPPAAAGQ